MEIRARHWLVAVSTAALAHLTVVAGIRTEPQPPPPAPIVIQLGESGAPEGGSGSSADASDGAPMTSLAAAAPLAALAATETLKAAVVEPPRRSVAKPKPKPKPKPKSRPKPKRTEKPKPRTRSAQPSRPSTAASDSAKPRTKGSGDAASTRSGGGGKGSGKAGSGRGKGGAGSGRGKGSGLGPQGTANYHGKLVAWLNRHKRYPSRARRLRQEGTVRVSFTIDRSGRVLSHRIVASSGHALLDQEVKAMLRRASPLPAFPPKMSQSRLTITVPIRFNLR